MVNNRQSNINGSSPQGGKQPTPYGLQRYISEYDRYQAFLVTGQQRAKGAHGDNVRATSRAYGDPKVYNQAAAARRAGHDEALRSLPGQARGYTYPCPRPRFS